MGSRTLKKTIQVDEVVEYPDEFASDTSGRGRAVDALLRAGHFDPDRLRSNLWDDELGTVQSAIQRLTEAYAQVDAVLATALPEAPENKALIRFHEEGWPSTTLSDDAQMDPLRRGYTAMRDWLIKEPRW